MSSAAPSSPRWNPARPAQCASKEIGQAKAQKDEAKAAALMEEVARLKTDVPALEAEVKAIEKALNDQLAAIPNVRSIPCPRAGTSTTCEIKVVGEKRTYDFTPKQHFEIGEALGLMDFETAAKLSGARFVVNKGRWRGWNGRGTVLFGHPYGAGTRLHGSQSALAGA